MAARRRHRGPRTVAVSAVLAAVVLGAGLSACSTPLESRPSDRPPPARTTVTETLVHLGDLLDPTPGLVRVDGSGDPLTTGARTAYAERSDEVVVTQDSSGETRAFERLCVGDVDLVDGTRPMTADEYARCRDHGLDVVRLVVASDGVVLATGRQTDVGTDCLTTAQVRAAVEAGSTVTRWSEVGPGLADGAFALAGPPGVAPLPTALARTVLGLPAPTGSDLRADYAVTETEDQALAFVAGPPGARVDEAAAASLTRAHAELKAALTRAWAVWGAADDEVEAAVLEQRRGVRDGRAPAARAQDDARVARALETRRAALGRVVAARTTLRPVDDDYRDLAERRRLVDEARGRVALFSYAYYAAHADLLQALEVDAGGGPADGADRSCVLPDQQTILEGRYPLSQEVALTVTTRSLERPEVRAFLRDYLDRSQDLARRAGWLPLPDTALARQRSWLDGADAPRFGVVDGRVDELPAQGASDTAPAAPPVQVPAR